MTCPSCATDLSQMPDGIGVCPTCARSVVKDEAGVRFATDQDLQALTAGEQAALRKARPATWRADVAARKKQIRGR